MKSYEIVFQSVNSEAYAKPIRALVMEPDGMGVNTGAMLFTHGWGGNRFQYQETMEFACDEFDLACVSVEYRGSGFEADPTQGRGWVLPYDASFYQVFDVLNGLRTVLDLHPRLERRRLFHYGGSQGGHICLLSAIFAPATFACVFAASPITRLDLPEWARLGRELMPHEASVRNVIEHADAIRCPVYLEHGTADDVVPHDRHTMPLAARLQSLGRQVQAKYYEGGGHSLQPVTDRLTTFKSVAPEPLRTLRREGEDDFTAERIIEIPCGGCTLRIDWSKPTHSHELFSWTEARKDG